MRKHCRFDPKVQLLQLELEKMEREILGWWKKNRDGNSKEKKKESWFRGQEKPKMLNLFDAHDGQAKPI